VQRTLNGPVPDRIARLPRDVRGYPVPFFVEWAGGKPPVMDPDKMKACMRRSLCWICGEPLGTYKAFAIGPMCTVNRISAEPPQHVDCAKFATANCPFMTQPLAKRASMDKFGPVQKPGGVMIERNPGVTAIWVTKSFTVIRDAGKPLWRLGPATTLQFWARGRHATRSEVDHSIGTGLPILRKHAAMEGPEAIRELERQLATTAEMLANFVTWPPVEPDPDPKNFGNPDYPDVDLSSFEAQP
jgi:hypothetical protein